MLSLPVERLRCFVLKLFVSGIIGCASLSLSANSVYESMHQFFSTPNYEENYHFFEITLTGVERRDRELVWSKRLAEVLGADEEVRVERGRVDVLAENYAIEVDRFEKYHEAIGQAIHYRAETGKTGVIALMVTRENLDLGKAAYIEENLCLPNDLKMIVLYAGGVETQMAAATGEPEIQKSEKDQALVEIPFKINLNTATLADLEILPGLGPTRAAAIVENRPFASVEDVLKVRGIGEATLNKIRPYVVVEGG